MSHLTRPSAAVAVVVLVVLVVAASHHGISVIVGGIAGPQRKVFFRGRGLNISVLDGFAMDGQQRPSPSTTDADAC